MAVKVRTYQEFCSFVHSSTYAGGWAVLPPSLVAAYVGVSRAAVHKAMREGRLPFEVFAIGGRRVKLVLTTDAVSWAQRRVVDVDAWEFIRRALGEKLDHRRRSRRRKGVT